MNTFKYYNIYQKYKIKYINLIKKGRNKNNVIDLIRLKDFEITRNKSIIVPRTQKKIFVH
jgi:hypothetical protein